MAQKDIVNERDFYAQKEVELYDVLKYAFIVILANFMAYYLVSCIYYFISKLAASSLYLILQSIFIYVPICAVFPVFFIFQYIRHFVPKHFSLADSPRVWIRKMIKWVGVGEIARFLIGLIPLSITQCGVITSPVTYHLYTLFYLEPLGKFEAVMLNGNAETVDIAVFLLIYCLYFGIYCLLLYKKLKREIIRHMKYLEGCMNEKKRFYDFNKNEGE